MKTEKTRVFIRVVPQFTIIRNRVSLIAEESVTPFKKGGLVMQVSRSAVHLMAKPYQVEIVAGKDKNKQVKYKTIPVIPTA